LGGREAAVPTILPPAGRFRGSALNIYRLFIRGFISNNCLAWFEENQMRTRTNRVAWRTCTDCCKSITKIAKSIHLTPVVRCKCGSFNHKRATSLAIFHYDHFRISQAYQEEYGIAWAMEGWI
jgi:hypothetical protein